MRGFHGGLGQQEAVFRLLQIDSGLTAPQRLRTQHLIDASLNDPLIVILGIERIGRELEPPSTLDAAVTFLVVASPLGEDPSHVACEAEGPRTAAGPDSNLSPGRPAFKLAGQHDLARFQGGHPTRLNQARDPGVGETEAAPPGEVTPHAVRIHSRQQKSLGGARTRQLHLARLKLEGNQAGRGGSRVTAGHQGTGLRPRQENPQRQGAQPTEAETPPPSSAGSISSEHQLSSTPPVGRTTMVGISLIKRPGPGPSSEIGRASSRSLHRQQRGGGVSAGQQEDGDAFALRGKAGPHPILGHRTPDRLSPPYPERTPHPRAAPPAPGRCPPKIPPPGRWSP